MSMDPQTDQTPPPLPPPPHGLPPELVALGVTLHQGRWIVPLTNKYKAQTVIRRLRREARETRGTVIPGMAMKPPTRI